MMIWLIILGMTVVTFGVRLSFTELFGNRSLPQGLQRALQFVPVSVLTAIFVPDLITAHGAYMPSLANGRLVAGIAAAVVAWRTKNILLTLAVGMAVLFAVQAISG